MQLFGQRNGNLHDISFDNCNFHVVKAPIKLENPEDYPAHFWELDNAKEVHITQCYHYMDENAAPFWRENPI